MKLLASVSLLLFSFLRIGGCSNAPTAGKPSTSTPPEKYALTVVTAAKAFLDSEKQSHPECAQAGPTSTLCINIHKAVSAKDALIDATEIYCGGGSFGVIANAPCNAPAKTSSTYQIALAKLQSAIDNYNQTELDVKNAAKGAQ